MYQAIPLLCILCTRGYVMVLASVDLRDSDFSVVVNKKEFVDKTLLIRTVFKSPEKVLITVPSRSGRSTNIDMMKRFLEIEVDEKGTPTTKSIHYNNPVNDTYNYNIFFYNNLTITRSRRHMNKYFGTFPVIHVDFQCKHKITNSENSVVCFREIIHRAFVEHKYLRKSEYLNTKQRRFIKKWADKFGSYEKFYGQDVTNSLYKLSVILYKHFGSRRVFVLIDNYDYPSRSAVFEVKDSKELYRVVRFNMGIISKLLSADYKYVERAVVTGLSYAAATRIHKLTNVQYCRFLENHPFVPFFGFTKPEVDTLFMNPVLNLDSKVVASAHVSYGGYLSLSGEQMYSLYPVLQFVRTGEVRNYEVQSGLFKKLNRLLKVHFIRDQIEKLVKGGVVVIPMNDTITVDDIFNLRTFLVSRKSEERFNINLLFYLLLEQGYLTYDQQSEESQESLIRALKIPNKEVKTLYAFKLKEYYDGIYRLDKTLLKKCASFFNDISSSLTANKALFKRALYWLYTSFVELIAETKSRFSKLGGIDVRRLVFSVIYTVNFKGSNYFNIDINSTKDVVDIYMVNGNFGVILQLNTNSSNDNIAKEIQDTSPDRFRNKLQASAGVTKSMFISLAINQDLQLSIRCLPDTRNVKDAIYIPEVHKE